MYGSAEGERVERRGTMNVVCERRMSWTLLRWRCEDGRPHGRVAHETECPDARTPITRCARPMCYDDVMCDVWCRDMSM